MLTGSVIVEALTVAASIAQTPGEHALNRVLQLLTNLPRGIKLTPVQTQIIWSMLKYFKVNCSVM